MLIIFAIESQIYFNPRYKKDDKAIVRLTRHVNACKTSNFLLYC